MEKGMTDITDIVFSQNNEREEEKEEKNVGAKEIGGEEKNSGGIINNLSPKVRDGTDDSTSAEAKNGGVFNTLISGILHQNGGEEDKGEEKGGATERERGGGSDGGAGLIDNLVSHLPTSLADDAAPATEEASILIHSIVHD